MTLVERFIEINRWPTSRKTTWLAGLALAGTPVTLWVTRALQRSHPVMDMHMVEIVLTGAFVTMALCFALSALEARAGREGRWTAYMFVVIYGTPITLLLFGLGTWSSPVFSLWVMGVLLAALVYDGKVAVFAFVVWLTVIASLTALQTAGVLPYAPAVLDRSIDAHASWAWAAAIMLPVGITFVLAFAVSVLLVGARELQDRRLAEAQRLIRRYVPSQLAERIFRGEHAHDVRPARAKLTIFFSDVVSFTDASDELDAEELAAILNEYLSEMSVIAEKHGATINQFVGDGIMIFFGAPTVTTDQDHALRAVRMALEMQERLAELQDTWHKRGIQKPFRARIGINTGHASVGDFGSKERKVYSAIGKQTNLAARIQAQCEPGKVLISHSTWGLVREHFRFAEKGELQVKGIHYPVKVYEVTAAA